MVSDLSWQPLFFSDGRPQPADRNNHISDGVTAPIEKYVIFAARKYIHIPDAGRNSSQPAPYIADTLQTLLCLWITLCLLHVRFVQLSIPDPG